MVVVAEVAIASSTPPSLPYRYLYNTTTTTITTTSTVFQQPYEYPEESIPWILIEHLI